MEHQEFTPDATPQTSPDDARVAARRRFLKGTTLALPAVMTLHSVAAQATARSSGSQCANNMPQYPCVYLRDKPDDYARAKVGCYDKLYRKNKEWIGDGKQTYFRGINCVNQRDCWRRVSDGSIVTSSEELALINHETNTKRTKGAAGPCGEPRYAIIHFSAIDGRVMAVGEPQTPVGCIMTSITMACLYSLTGHG